MDVVNVIVLGWDHMISSYYVTFFCRAFARFCECVLPEGVDPNVDQGNGYNRCPLVNLSSLLPV